MDKDPILVIAANNDLYAQHEVKDKDDKTLAKEINTIFQSTLAYLNINITSLFENISKIYF